MITAALITYLLRQTVDRKDIAYRRAGLADDRAQLPLRVALLIDEPLQCLGLLHGGQILPLDVLDQGDLRELPLHTDARDP